MCGIGVGGRVYGAAQARDPRSEDRPGAEFLFYPPHPLFDQRLVHVCRVVGMALSVIEAAL